MSFAKAKIHRFNDEVSCAPPPGAYDPKYDDKIKCAIIPGSERFPERKISETRSLCSSIESLDSGESNGLAFRTPILPRQRRIALTPSLTRLKLDPLVSRPTLSSSKCEHKKEIESLQLEKQKEIEELERTVQKLTENMNRIQDELKQKQQEEKVFQESNKKLMIELSDSQVTYESKLHTTQNLLNLKTNEVEELKTFIKELSISIDNKQQTILTLQAALSNMALEISDFKKHHDKEKMRLAHENLSEHSKLKDLIEDLEEKMRNERLCHETYVNDFKNQIKNLEEKCSKEMEEKKDMEIGMIEKEAYVADLREQVNQLQNELYKVKDEKRAFELSVENELKEKEVYLTELQEQLISLQNIVHEMQIEKDTLMIENANTMLELSLKHEERLQTMRESFENRLQALKCSLSEDETNYRSLQAWIAEKIDSFQETTFSDLKQKETENISKINELSKSYHTLKNHVKFMKYITHGKIKKYSAETESKYNKIFDRLARKKEGAETERDNLKTVNENQETAIKNLETDLSCAQKECSKYQLISKNAQAAVDALTVLLSESGTQIESLQESEKTLKTENEKLVSSLKDKETAYDALEVSMNALEMDLIKQVKEEHSKLLSTIENFKIIAENQKRMYEGQLEELLTCRLNLEEEIKVYQIETDDHRSEIASLKCDLKIKSNESSKLEAGLHQITLLVSSLSSKSSENIEDEYRFICSNLNNLMEDRERKCSLIHQLETILAEKERMLKESELNRKELLERFESLENRTNEILIQNENSVSELISVKDKMSKTQEEIDCLTAEKDSLNCRISGLKLEIESLSKLNSDKSRTIESLSQNLALKSEEVEIMSKDLENLNLTLLSHQSLVAELQSSIEEKQNEIIDLEASVDSFYCKLKEREDVSDQVEEKEKLIKDLLQEKNQIMTDYSEKILYLESLNSDYFEKLQITEDSLETYKEEINELKACKDSEIQGLKEEIQSLTKQVEMLLDEKESLKVVMSRNSHNLQLMSDKLTDYNRLQKQCDDLEAELKVKSGMLEKLEKQNTDLEDQLKVKSEMFESLEKQSNELKASLESKSEKESSEQAMKAQKNKYKMYALQLQEEYDILKQELESKDQLIATKEKSEETLKMKCSKLEDLIEPFKQLLEDFEKENKLLESKAGSIEGEKKALLMKYADALGHQNPKQKIRHLNKIIEENHNLMKENERLKRQIKKLSGSQKSNVENGLNSIKVEEKLSPCLPKSEKSKPGCVTPLRERN